MGIIMLRCKGDYTKGSLLAAIPMRGCLFFPLQNRFNEIIGQYNMSLDVINEMSSKRMLNRLQELDIL